MAALGIALLLLGATGVAVADEHHHEHPDEASEDGDLADVERWLSDRMGQQHVDCSEGIEVGDYDACEDLDSEYSSLVDRYVTVEREREGSTETAEQLNETRQQQREYADRRERFDQTYEEYREAREAGDEERAREKARELQQHADRLEQVGGNLTRNLGHLDGDVDANLSQSADQINDSTAEVQRTRDDVVTESFEPTTLEASVSAVSSFADPGQATGTVTHQNGSAISGGRIVVDDGAQLFNGSVDEDGSFDVAYRPAPVAPRDRQLRIHYVPEDTDPYLGSEDTATTTVETTPSTVTITNATEGIAVGEPLRVAGDLQAADRGVGGVPVTVLVDGQEIATNRTTSNGSYDIETPFPANVSDGDVDLEVVAAQPNLAIGTSRATSDLTVAETASELSVTTAQENGSVTVSGRLQAANDAPVGERPLTVTVGDTEYDVTTDAAGYYSVDYPGEAEYGTQVTASYREDGSNLEPSSAATTLRTGSPLSSVLATAQRALENLAVFAGSNPRISAMFGAGVLLILGAGVVRHRRRRHADRPEAEPEPQPAPEPDAEDPASPSESAYVALLDAARSRVGTDPEAAVRAGYAAVRARFAQNGATASQTHWEFYQATSRELSEAQAAALQALTESFERVEFSPGGIDDGEAEAAVQCAEQCLQGTE